MSENDYQEEMIEILYNRCYGGWTPSDKATELYNERMKQINPSFKSKSRDSVSFLCRCDPVLVQIYHELGEEFDDRRLSYTQIEKIPKKYKKYYTIEEYDGNESVSINMYKYANDNIKEQMKQILANNMTSDEKISEFHKLAFM